METQKVDDAVFNIVRRHCYGLISDVAMPAIRARGDDLQRIALISAGQRGNRLGHGGREKERAAAIRRRVQYFIQFPTKTHVEHFVGFRSEERRVGKERVSTCRSRWGR